MAEILVKRKDQIKETAQNMFREKGYSATSMRDLARAVGIEPASLYSHIKSKEEILSGICHRMADQFLESIEKVRAEERTVDELLRAAIEAHILVITKNLDASSVFFKEWRHLAGSDLYHFHEKRYRYQQFFRNIIDKGIEDGTFKNVEVDITLQLMFSTINGIHDWYNPKQRLSPQEIATKASDLLMNGLLFNTNPQNA